MENPFEALLQNGDKGEEALIEINGQKYIVGNTDMHQLTKILKDLAGAAPVVKMDLPVLGGDHEYQSIYIINKTPLLNSKVFFENYGIITLPRQAREYREAYLVSKGASEDGAIAQALEDVQLCADIQLSDERDVPDAKV